MKHACVVEPVWRISAAPRHAPLQGQATADVAVIGAGFVGLTAALELAVSGKSVILLAADPIGAGCSGASAGQVGPMLYGARKTPADVTARLGEERAARLHRLVAGSGRWLFDQLAELGIKCDARRGIAYLYRSDKSLARAGDTFTQWTAHGGRWEMLDRDALKRHIRTERYAGGIYVPEGGFVDPARVLGGLAAAADRAGIRLCPSSRVVSVRRQQDGWEAVTAQGRVRAAKLLVATGSGATPFWPELASTVYILDCGIVATAPLFDKGMSMLPGGGPVADMDDKALFAPAITADGRLIISLLTGEGIPDPRHGIAPVKRRLARVFPDRHPPSFRSFSGGAVSLTPDGLPRLLQREDGLLAVTGCNGLGLTLGIVAAREAARLIAGTSPLDLALPLTPARPLPGSRMVRALLRNLVVPLANRVGA